MKLKLIGYFCLCILVVLANNCSKNENKTIILSIQTIKSPAGSGSGEPNLFVKENGQVYLSWIEAVDTTRHALRFAVTESNSWSVPQTIADGDNWFVNWADFPSLVAFENGSLAAHWLVKSSESKFAYDVNVAQSPDGGMNWSQPFSPHRDGTLTEHGFVSMLPWRHDRLFLVWLDGRKFAKESNGKEAHGAPTNEMTLRFAMMDKDGGLHDERVLDPRVCDCCPTSAVKTANGALVVYRDRSEQEVRDISIVRLQNGVWSEPHTLYADGWEIAGCPVNGPAIAAEGPDVAAAWFTMANDTPRVKVIFLNNQGLVLGQPIIVDDGDPIGRVDLVMLPDGAAAVSWLETTKDGAEIRLRKVMADGSRETSIIITKSSKERASGFPRMVRSGNQIYFAWTQSGQPSIVHTAVANLSGTK